MSYLYKLGTALAVGAMLLLSTAGAQGLETNLTIVMDEMFFQLEGQEPNEEIRLETGVPYIITFQNIGDVEHRVKFGRGVAVEEGVPYAYTEDLFTNVRVRVTGTSGDQQFAVDIDQLGELDLEPGATVEMSFTLPYQSRGTWEIGCFVPSTANNPNHYVAGMVTPLVVSD